MKRLTIVPAIFLLALFSLNCEKDDICDPNTATTPKLVIQFYDATNPTVLKNVTQLSITSEGLADPVGVYNGVSTVELPLKTTDDLTQYTFVLNSTDAATDNTDRVDFSYTRSNVFVSRACGYKTLFTFADTNPILRTDAAVPDGLWIQNITVNQPNIENEDETHVNIYF